MSSAGRGNQRSPRRSNGPRKSARFEDDEESFIRNVQNDSRVSGNSGSRMSHGGYDLI